MTRILGGDLIAGAVSRALFRPVLSLLCFVAAFCGVRFMFAGWLARGFLGMARIWVAFPAACTDCEAARAHHRFTGRASR